ncbi:MAG: hypothetical protein ACP5QK_13315, partial [Myxococcota bacterium]
WDVRGKNNLSIGWEDILKIDKERLISLKNGDVDNLYTDFYTGKIITCGPKFGTVNESGQDFYRSKIFEGCESINIDDGLNCGLQNEYGIYNYYCFLRLGVDKAREIKKEYPEVDVYVSISNDHIAPAVFLPYIKIGDTDLLTEYKRYCPECKFTNALVIDNLDWDEYWQGEGGPYLIKESTYKELMKGYINHPSFLDMGLGVNAYIEGSCVKIKNYNDYDVFISHFCKGYDSNDKSYKEYVISVNNSKFSKMYENYELIMYGSDGTAYKFIYKDENQEIQECNWDRISLAIKNCEDKLKSCIGFDKIDPPFSSSYCSGVYECKNLFYKKYIEYIRDNGDISVPLFVS